ncbi:MAG: nucleotidyltransferase domain-containing protein [Oligoflexia bacterium]|nr:nucleotidyltransferase domain-containing protein [Oligoflexia bacterium]
MVKTKDEIKKISADYAKLVASIFHNVEVRLFGSYHKGQPNEWSDIDLAIISPDFAKMDYILSLQILQRLKVTINDSIEPISLTREEFQNPELGSIAWEIARNSERVPADSY